MMSSLRTSYLIIQQIVTMPIYGKEALNICHPYMTDLHDRYPAIYVNDHIWKCTADFSFIACLAAILKSEAVLAVFSGGMRKSRRSSVLACTISRV